MPHAIIEYSANLKNDFQNAGGTAMVHRALSGTGVFAPENLKTRAYQADDFQVGLDGAAGSFVHIIVYLLEGRTTEQKQQLGQPLLAALREAIPAAKQISVDIRELDTSVYQKHRS